MLTASFPLHLSRFPVGNVLLHPAGDGFATDMLRPVECVHRRQSVRSQPRLPEDRGSLFTFSHFCHPSREKHVGVAAGLRMEGTEKMEIWFTADTPDLQACERKKHICHRKPLRSRGCLLRGIITALTDKYVIEMVRVQRLARGQSLMIVTLLLTPV